MGRGSGRRIEFLLLVGISMIAAARDTMSARLELMRDAFGRAKAK